MGKNAVIKYDVIKLKDQFTCNGLWSVPRLSIMNIFYDVLHD